jgi:chemotaxis protein CheD
MRSGVPAEKLSCFLEPGYIFVPAEPVTIHAVLGSCVAVCLWDQKRQVGGMNHFLWPFTSSPKEATPCYGNVATMELINMMERNGSKKKNLLAQVLGGAMPKLVPNATVGAANVDIARSILQKRGIPICSEDVGGQMGRKIVFDTHTGHVMVLKVHKLRDTDWITKQARTRKK